MTKSELSHRRQPTTRRRRLRPIDSHPLRPRILTPSLPPGANMDCPKRASVAAGLPDDPLVEILSRVPAKSLCRFKCVFKAWRYLINDPLHRKKLPQAMEGLFVWAKGPGGCGGEGEGECAVRHFSFIDLTARSVPLDIDSCFSSVLTGL